MRSERTRIIVEIGLTLALCAALKMFAIRLPINIAGGTISLDMLPIMVLALRRGVWVGVLSGALWGVTDLAFEPYAVYPIQFLLDYPIAFGLVGLAGLGSNRFNSMASEGRAVAGALWATPWMLLGATGRLIAHVVSGVVFFAANAPAGQPVFLYSLTYNLSYWVPSTIATVAAALVVLPVLARAVPVAPPTERG